MQPLAYLTPLAIGLGLLAVGLAAWAVVSGRAKLLAAAAVCALLGAAAFGADYWIVTEAEKLEARVHELADALIAGESERALSHFSPTAAAERAAVRAGLAFVVIDPDLRLSDWQIEVTANDTRGTTHFRANGTVGAPKLGFSQHVATRWQLVWRKEADVWKIVEARRLDPITGETIDFMDGR